MGMVSFGPTHLVMMAKWSSLVGGAIRLLGSSDPQKEAALSFQEGRGREEGRDGEVPHPSGSKTSAIGHEFKGGLQSCRALE